MHILTSNSMVSHAIWKNTREFLNTSKCTRFLNSCNFDRLWITHSCILFPDCTRNHTNAYTNNYRVYQTRDPRIVQCFWKVITVISNFSNILFIVLQFICPNDAVRKCKTVCKLILLSITSKPEVDEIFNF
jgi:hypothetical protein